jgi:adenylate kinase family enzyme
MEHPRRFQVEPPRRVLVVGNRGSGRGRIAKLICDRFSLPLIDIEREQGAFPQKDDIAAWRDHVRKLAEGPEWVMSGNDIASFNLRVPRADWFIWVDLPISTCALAVLRRAIRVPVSGKTSMSIVERLRLPRFSDILNFPTELAPRIMGTIERERRNRTIFILRSRHEISQFLSRLPEAGGFGDHLAKEGGKPSP